MPETMRQNSDDLASSQSRYTNGSSLKRLSSTTNGNGYTNGRAGGSSLARDTWYGHDRQEVARLLIQGLQDLGYNESAGLLVRESGHELESPAVAAFRQSVLDGDWAEAESLLVGSRVQNGRGIDHSNGHSPSHGGFALAGGVDELDLRFQLRRQKYLELLEARDHAGALMVLRQELTPLHRDTGQLHNLSGLMVCPTAEDLRIQAVWDGAYGSSRQNLLDDLSKAISPSVMIPNHRLATLFTQIKQSQVSKCHYHNPIAKLSLFTDHACDRDQYPLRAVKELLHRDEVWYVEFSHDGTRLATAGQMKEISIWNTENFKETPMILEGHTDFVALVAWSPDDTKLISCSNDRLAKVWNTRTGDTLFSIENRRPKVPGQPEANIDGGEPITAAAWTPDGRSLVTGSLDRTLSLFLWSSTGEMEYEWVTGYRVNALAISPDGERLVVLSSDCQIHVYDFRTREEIRSIKLNRNLTCVSISRDSNYALVNMAENELQLINIDTAEVVERFLGQKQSVNQIRSTFGGADETLVITGSEDGKVYVFNKGRSTLIEKLVGHTGSVNAIAWNSQQACMFASAGDDHKVRIWMKPPGGPSSSRAQPLPIPPPNNSRSYASYSTLL